MLETKISARRADAEVDPLFLERWSPRAFEDAPLDEDAIETLFEAARWSPSCFNEQPWVFVYARSASDRERFAALLKPGNRAWASRAPLLVFVAARRHFTHNGKRNRWAAFDTGAAWMALTLQARMLGLHTHAMAGVDFDAAYEELGLDPETYELQCAVAVGRRGDRDVLSEELAARERPSDRNAASSFVFEGRR